jgi:hypothetical protein
LPNASFTSSHTQQYFNLLLPSKSLQVPLVSNYFILQSDPSKMTNSEPEQRGIPDEEILELCGHFLARHAPSSGAREGLKWYLTQSPPVIRYPIAPPPEEFALKQNLINGIYQTFTTNHGANTSDFNRWTLAVLFYMPVDSLRRISTDEALIERICNNAEDFIKLCKLFGTVL